MREKVSKLKWNFFSILITILLGLGFYHFYIVPKANEYKIIDKIEFKVICEIKSKEPFINKDLCPGYQEHLKNFIKIHLIKIYNLSTKVHVNLDGPVSYFTFKTFNFKHDTELIDSLNKIIVYQSDIYKRNMNILLISATNTYLINEIDNLARIEELSKNKLFSIVYKDLIKMKEMVFDNIGQLNRINKTYEDLKPEQMYSLKIKKDPIKTLLYPKLKRLNYINVFLTTFVFGILINILFALIIEIKKLYKW